MPVWILTTIALALPTAQERPPAVYFSDTGQEVVASQGQVRAGAPDLPYALKQAGVIAKTGTSSYTGCQAWRETAVSDIWTRADDTTFTEAKGAGAPEGPVDVCVSTNVKSGEVNLTRWCSFSPSRNPQPCSCGG